MNAKFLKCLHLNDFMENRSSRQIMDALDTLLVKLEITPKIYKSIDYGSPDFHQYPVEFGYLTRCLYQFGQQMTGYRLVDLNSRGWIEAIIYAIQGKKFESTQCLPSELAKIADMQQICDLFGLRILILGPDEEQLQLIIPSTTKSKSKKVLPIPYVILFHSYDDLWYPLVSVDGRQTNLFYESSDDIVTYFLESSKYNKTI